MVKRRTEEQIAGVLEFEGQKAEDPEFIQWLAAHKERNGGKIRVSQGGRGVRVMFAKEADMTLWRTRYEQSTKKKAAG